MIKIAYPTLDDDEDVSSYKNTIHDTITAYSASFSCIFLADDWQFEEDGWFL